MSAASSWAWRKREVLSEFQSLQRKFVLAAVVRIEGQSFSDALGRCPFSRPSKRLVSVESLSSSARRADPSKWEHSRYFLSSVCLLFRETAPLPLVVEL